MKLKPCGCGRTPTELSTYGNYIGEYTFIYGNCCGEWFVEVPTDYEKDPEKLQKIMMSGWNEAERYDVKNSITPVKKYSNLDVLLRPKLWLRNYPVNEGWDDKLNQLMDNGVGVKRLNHYEVVFDDGTVIWVSNFPYAYGSNGLNDGYLPSRKTALRLAKYLALNVRYKEVKNG